MIDLKHCVVSKSVVEAFWLTGAYREVESLSEIFKKSKGEI